MADWERDPDAPLHFNSIEFPPLATRTKHESLTVSSGSTTTMRRTSGKVQATKRSMRDDEEDDLLSGDNLTLSGASGSSESLNSSSPTKKSRRLVYREPQPVLLSLDSDALKNLFDSPTLSDSQNSDIGFGSRLNQGFASPVNPSAASSLGSLTDIIEKYNSTTLDSFKGFDGLSPFSDNAQSSPCLQSPASVHMESPGTPKDFPSLVAPNLSLSPRQFPAILTSPGQVPLTLSQGEHAEEDNVKMQSYTSVETINSTISSAVNTSDVQFKVVTSESCTELQRTNIVQKSLSSVNMAMASQTSAAPQPSNLMSFDDEISSVISKADSGVKETFTVKSYQEKEVKITSHSNPAHRTEPATFEEQVGNYDSQTSQGKGKNRKSRKDTEISEDKVKFHHSDKKGAVESVKVNRDKKDHASDSSGSDTSTPERCGRNEAEHEYRKCKKNPGHKKFYAPGELKVTDLPPEIQNEDSLTCLTCLSQLVIQISVNSTSAARGPDDVYSDYIGTSKKRNGSGFIASVDEDIRKFRCRIEDCPYGKPAETLDSSLEDSLNVTPTTPTLDRTLSNISTASSSSSSSVGSQRHSFYSGVNIHTNRHIIYDMSEAQNAYVKFFYNTPDGVGVINGHVAAIVGVNTNQDHVILHVMSHDKALFNIIGLHMKNAKSSYKQMVESTGKMHEVHGHKYKHSWVAIISHPHGMSKATTVGRVRRETVDGLKIVKYYDAPTCPGSSGGLVITPSLLKLQWPGAVHSGTDGESGYNVTFDSRVQDLDYKVMGKIHKSLMHRKKSSFNKSFSL